MCPGWINFEVSSCEWPKHAKTHFLSKRPAGGRDSPSSAKEDKTGTGKSTSALQHVQTKIARDEDPSGCASKLCLQTGLQNDRGLTNLMTHLT